MKKNVLFRLLNYIGRNKLLLLASVICAVISVVSNLAGPVIVGRAIDSMSGKGNVNFTAVIKYLLVLMAIYGLSSLFTWLISYFTNRISYKTVNFMRQDLFRKLNTLPLKFFDTTPHGDTISRFVNDIDSISDGMLQGIATLLTGVITIVGALIFMNMINTYMMLFVALSAPVTFFVARFITTNSQRYFKEQAKRLGALNGYVEEIISGQRTVKAFSYENTSFEKFGALNSELYDAGLKSQFFGAMVNPSTRVVNNITYSIIGIAGSIFAISGQFTIGDILSFLLYSSMFSKPFNEITGVITQMQAALASGQRIFSILDTTEEIPDGPGAKSLDSCEGNIHFSGVDFSYTQENPLIKNLNLDIKQGSRIAIVGKTGAGKTTLVNLLMRFYEVNSGTISIDGTDIKDIKRDSLRKSFGMVLQDTFLFNDTIANNIAYGKSGATMEEVIAAAKSAGAHSFIRRLPKGYNTVISGAAENLSQGEKQLLTIARVMLADPPMLILDEATSSIDTRTELHIQNAFKKMMEGRTSFIIAHRLSTIKEADNILVMDHGNIVESGTHEDLLKKKGHYFNIYNSQFPSV